MHPIHPLLRLFVLTITRDDNLGLAFAASTIFYSMRNNNEVAACSQVHASWYFTLSQSSILLVSFAVLNFFTLGAAIIQFGVIVVEHALFKRLHTCTFVTLPQCCIFFATYPSLAICFCIIFVPQNATCTAQSAVITHSALFPFAIAAIIVHAAMHLLISAVACGYSALVCISNQILSTLHDHDGTTTNHKLLNLQQQHSLHAIRNEKKQQQQQLQLTSKQEQANKQKMMQKTNTQTIAASISQNTNSTHESSSSTVVSVWVDSK